MWTIWCGVNYPSQALQVPWLSTLGFNFVLVDMALNDIEKAFVRSGTP